MKIKNSLILYTLYACEDMWLSRELELCEGGRISVKEGDC